MNNTVGTMMTCSVEGKPCEIALVVGEQRAPRMAGWWVLGGHCTGAHPHCSCRPGHQQLLHGRSIPGGDGRGQWTDVCQHRVGLLWG